jgi:hypothetical protein
VGRRVRLQATYQGATVLGDVTSDLLTLAGVSLTADTGKALTPVTLTLPAEDLRRVDLGNASGTQLIQLAAVLTDDAGTIYDGWTVLADLSLTPVLESLSKTSALEGETVELVGGGFGKTQPPGGHVTVNGVEAIVTAWSDTSISITVPTGATSGDVLVRLRPEAAYASQPIHLNVSPAPVVGVVKNIMLSIGDGTMMYGLFVHAGWTSDTALTTDVISVDVRPEFTPSAGLLGGDVAVDYEIWVDGAVVKTGSVNMIRQPGGVSARADLLNVSLGTMAKGHHTIGLVLDPSLKITDPLAPERNTYRVINADLSVADSYF